MLLVPIQLDDTEWHTSSRSAAHLRTRHIGNVCGWKDHDRYHAVFARLLWNLTAKD